MKRFQSVAKGTVEAEARLRAVSLAAQWSKDAHLQHEKPQVGRAGSYEKIRNSARSMAVAMGGDESEPSSRRHSHDSRRSLDASFSRSVERGRRKLGLKRHYYMMSEEALIEESLTSTKNAYTTNMLSLDLTSASSGHNAYYNVLKLDKDEHALQRREDLLFTNINGLRRQRLFYFTEAVSQMG